MRFIEKRFIAKGLYTISLHEIYGRKQAEKTRILQDRYYLEGTNRSIDKLEAEKWYYKETLQYKQIYKLVFAKKAFYQDDFIFAIESVDRLIDTYEIEYNREYPISVLSILQDRFYFRLSDDIQVLQKKLEWSGEYVEPIDIIGDTLTLQCRYRIDNSMIEYTDIRYNHPLSKILRVFFGGRHTEVL